MESRSFNPTPLLLAFGLVAFGIAGLSIADLAGSRAYDGVVPADIEDRLVVQEVIPGSGADRAGIGPGDEIKGIAGDAVSSAVWAARVLEALREGDEVVYLVKKADGSIAHPKVRLGRRQIADGSFFYSATLGFSFFLVGLFVLVRQPTLRVSQVFFLLCGLFLLFLVCRMRPASYSGLDTLILNIGTIAFLLLPSAFLHFYLLFPRPAWLNAASESAVWYPLARLWRRGWPLLYAVPPLVFLVTLLIGRTRGEKPQLTHGAPAANWWLLALFMLLGLVGLWANSRRLRSPRERRGLALVLIGSFFGLAPFVVTSLVFTTRQHSDTFFFLGIMPLLLVPLTFAYAIFRFQLLDIQVILRRSLLYTVTTALLTGVYAGGIATFAFFRGSKLSEPGYFPILLALAIVLLFDPLRRRVQEVIDRYFFAGRSSLERATVDLGEAMSAQMDLRAVVEELVDKLPQLLGLRFAALYLLRGYRLERAAGPETLPAELPVLPELERHLQRRGKLTRLDQLGALPLRSREVAEMVATLNEAGVEAIANLASRRRHIGMVVLSEKQGQIAFERDELQLLERLLHQAALALETSMLLDERTQKAELEREIAIAATIQAQLLPAELCFADGWQVAAECRPARIVGGDFFAQLPTGEDGRSALIFGDVSGKSVAGALMMMAAHEALYALALTRPRPSELFALTNRRMYQLGKRSFVALGYFAAAGADGKSLRYLVAGQPPPLLRSRDGQVRELPLPEHRLPIGAMPDGNYRELVEAIEPGDVVLGYSDGVTEARAPSGEFFGSERLLDVVIASPADCRQVVQNVLEAVRDFTQGGVQYDDVTLVAVGRTEDEPMIGTDS